MRIVTMIFVILVLLSAFYFNDVHAPGYEAGEKYTPSSESQPSTGNRQDKEPYIEQTADIPEKPVEINGLIELTELDDSFVIDLRYATANNFTGKKIYTQPRCILHKDTALKLISANNHFKSLGCRIKILDAYRPYSAQRILWNAASDKSFVADPTKGSNHNRGAAVDITLVDKDGKELEMPSAFDEFTRRASIKYTDCPKEQIENRELMGRIMVQHGFSRINSEWWHFNDINAKEYPVQDIPFEKFSR